MIMSLVLGILVNFSICALIVFVCLHPTHRLNKVHERALSIKDSFDTPSP